MDKFSQRRSLLNRLDQNNTLEKEAQERSLLNKIREKANMPKSYIEGFFRPEMDRVMASLQLLDDKVRSELTGTKIGKADAPEITTSAKDLLKEARKNFNRREYMTGVADLGMFHKKMFNVVQDISKFNVDVNKIHHKFLFEGVDKDKIKQLREHMERKAEFKTQPYFIKEAGIMDFFYNIGTKRGRDLAAWRKKYPKETDALEKDGLKVLDAADRLLERTLTQLKAMATARATRHPDDYVNAGNEIVREFNKFDNGKDGFKNYYNSVVLPFLSIYDKVEAEQAKEDATPSKPTSSAEPITLNNTKPVNLPIVPNLDVSTQKPQAVELEMAPDTVPQDLEVSPNTLRSEELEKAKQASFISSLEKMGSESPQILASYINKYAKSIQKNNPETSKKLLNLVQQIKK